MPLKPLELREMTLEERQERQLAIKRAREAQKPDTAEESMKKKRRAVPPLATSHHEAHE